MTSSVEKRFLFQLTHSIQYLLNKEKVYKKRKFILKCLFCNQHLLKFYLEVHYTQLHSQHLGS